MLRSSLFSSVLRDADGRIKHVSKAHPNLRTTAGMDWQANVMGSSTQPAPCQWLAVSADTTTPSASDTSLTGEIVGSGLTRAQGTFTHTNGVSNFTIAFTYTLTGTQTINKGAAFNALSSGTMPFEALEPSSVVGVSGDSYTQKVQVNL